MLTAGAWDSPAGGSEYLLGWDEGRERRLLVAPALFDEGNKLRHFTVEVICALAEQGVDCFLPDLPGTNESFAVLAEQTLTGWREAVASVAAQCRATHVLSVRGGALCLSGGLPAAAYAPVTGSTQLRGLLRARMLTDREAGLESSRDDLLEQGLRKGLELAGYRLGAAMIAELEAAKAPADAATIAQAELGGAGLWLRAEPDHDPEQASALVHKVLEWIG